jgi:hypothetical protein
VTLTQGVCEALILEKESAAGAARVRKLDSDKIRVQNATTESGWHELTADLGKTEKSNAIRQFWHGLDEQAKCGSKPQGIIQVCSRLKCVLNFVAEDSDGDGEGEGVFVPGDVYFASTDTKLDDDVPPRGMKAKKHLEAKARRVLCQAATARQKKADDKQKKCDLLELLTAHESEFARLEQENNLIPWYRNKHAHAARVGVLNELKSTIEGTMDQLEGTAAAWPVGWSPG